MNLNTQHGTTSGGLILLPDAIISLSLIIRLTKYRTDTSDTAQCLAAH